MTTSYVKTPTAWLGGGYRAGADVAFGICIPAADVASVTQEGDIVTENGGLLIPAANIAAHTVEGDVYVAQADIAGHTLAGDTPAVAAGDIYLSPAQVAAYNVTMLIPAAAFPEITLATEADETTGDFANILYGMLHQTYAKFKALTVAKPVNWAIYKSETLSTTEGETVVSFNIQFTTVTPTGTKNVKSE